VGRDGKGIRGRTKRIIVISGDRRKGESVWKEREERRPEEESPPKKNPEGKRNIEHHK